MRGTNGARTRFFATSSQFSPYVHGNLISIVSFERGVAHLTYPKERVLLQLVGTGPAAAQAARRLFNQQLHDQVPHFRRQLVGDGRLDRQDAPVIEKHNVRGRKNVSKNEIPPRDLLLVVLLALDGEGRGAGEQFVREHPDAPPVDRLTHENKRQFRNKHSSPDSTEYYHIVTVTASAHNLRRHVLDGAAKRVRAPVLLSKHH